jgi:probable FeS assembly SUF system protein SufT
MIPSGDPTMLPSGLRVRVTQALGDSFTVLTENGLLARIAAEEAEALGREAPPKPEANDASGEFREEVVWDILRSTFDPEIPVNIVELGLIYAVEITPHEDGGKRVRVRMTLTAPGCGMGGVLKSDIERKLSRVQGVQEVEVEVVLDPPWSPALMSEAARLQLGMM